MMSRPFFCAISGTVFGSAAASNEALIARFAKFFTGRCLPPNEGCYTLLSPSRFRTSRSLTIHVVPHIASAFCITQPDTSRRVRWQ